VSEYNYKHLDMEAIKEAEKRFVRRMTTSIVSILVCLLGLSFSAYAYFTNNAIANIALIQSAYYELDIEPIETVQQNGDIYVLDNTAGSEIKTYQFNVKKSDTATAEVGYCKVNIKTDADTADSCQTYYTKPIGVFLDNGTSTEVLQRTVSVSVPAGKSAEVSFIAEWGTYSGTDAVADGEVIQPAFAVVVQLQEEEITDIQQQVIVENNLTPDESESVSEEEKTTSTEVSSSEDNTTTSSEDTVTSADATSSTDDASSIVEDVKDESTQSDEENKE